jgi:phenylacetate-CoA ligase
MTNGEGLIGEEETDMNKTEREHWNPEKETMDLGRLEELQLARLQEQLAHVYQNSAFYRKLYQEKGLHPQDVKRLEDFKRRVPIFNKEMIRRFRTETDDPFGGILCVETAELRWIGSTTGTSGQPTFTAMTQQDMDTHAEWGARVLWQAGVRPGGKAHITAPPYTKGGQTFQQGAERLGCTYLSGLFFPFEAPRIILTQNMFRPDTYFVMAPALLSAFNAEMEKQGLSSREVWSSCKSILWGGEPLTSVTRKRLEREWETDFVIIGGPGSDFGLPPMECRQAKDGGHVQEDLYLVEVVDPVTKYPLPEGKEGELVWTHLLDQATPYVRFSTEDIGVVYDEPCVCGRSGRRVKLLDRPEYGIKVNKRWVFSIQVREVLESYPETEEGVCQLVRYAVEMDKLRVRVGYRPEITGDSVELKDRLETAITGALGMKTEIELADKEAFETVAHKFVRVVDLT